MQLLLWKIIMTKLQKHLPIMMHSRTGCIYYTFLHCVFSNVASNRLPEKMHSRTGCIYLTFLQCVFSNVSSNHLPARRLHPQGSMLALPSRFHWSGTPSFGQNKRAAWALFWLPVCNFPCFQNQIDPIMKQSAHTPSPNCKNKLASSKLC